MCAFRRNPIMLEHCKKCHFYPNFADLKSSSQTIRVRSVNNTHTHTHACMCACTRQSSWHAGKQTGRIHHKSLPILQCSHQAVSYTCYFENPQIWKRRAFRVSLDQYSRQSTPFLLPGTLHVILSRVRTIFRCSFVEI